MVNNSKFKFNLPEVLDITDLGEWIKYCERHNVPHIPIEEVGGCWPGELLTYIIGEFDMRTPLGNIHPLKSKIEDYPLPEGYMYRWSCGATDSLKHEMDKNGKCQHNHVNDPFAGDVRLVELLQDHSNLTPVKLYKRPWIIPLYYDTHPVEFRVFVENDDIIGISNYYPQIELPASSYYYKLAEKVHEMTQFLMAATSSFSADWLIDESGNILFLEAGPPFSSGKTHPCCFEPEVRSGDSISGTKLTK